MERSYDKILYACPYGRLSLEDKDKKNFSIESNSIASQRTYIIQFCEDKNINRIHDGYFDDGITGLTFERENFQKMIRDIQMGLIDCVIIKDLSRLGRDHSETGYYIEKFFPEHSVRLISINDNWDSKYDSVDLILWKLAYNDVYCADISRKVKTILNSKKREGKWVGSFAPYGYLKHPDNKHQLIVDPETGPIVKEIFELAYSGIGTCGIAKILTEKGYQTPGERCGRHPKSTLSTFEKSGHIWTTGHVRRILSHEVYVGDTAQCKIKKVSYKSNKLVRNKKEDWIIVKNTHEPLVYREMFKEIQNKLEKTSKKYTRLPGEGCLLSKLLICKDCGHRISVSWKSSKNHDRGKSGVCNYYKKYSKYNVCTPHYIDYDELEEQVLDYVKNILNKRMEFFDTPKLIKENYKNIDKNLKDCQTRLFRLEKDKEKAEVLMLKMYEDKLEGKITDSMYNTLSNRKTIEIEEINKQITETKENINKAEEQLITHESKMKDEKGIIKRFLNSKIITQDLINQIIDKIYVGENDDIDIKFTIEDLNVN